MQTVPKVRVALFAALASLAASSLVRGQPAATVQYGPIVATQAGQLYNGSRATGPAAGYYTAGQLFCGMTITHLDGKKVTDSAVLVEMPSGPNLFADNTNGQFHTVTTGKTCARPTFVNHSSSFHRYIGRYVGRYMPGLNITTGLSVLGLAFAAWVASGLRANKKREGVWLTVADQWLAWTLPVLATGLFSVWAIYYMVDADMAADQAAHETQHIVPYPETLILTLYAATCLLLPLWHYFGGKAAGTPKRRAALWARKKKKWVLNQQTGDWRRIIRPALNGGYIVSTVPRSERVLGENTLFRWRVGLSPFVYAAGIGCLVGTDLLIYLDADQAKNSAFFIYWLYSMGFLLLFGVTFHEVLYESGTQFVFSKSPGAHGTGAMVLDPPPNSSVGKPFGDDTPITDTPPEAMDDLSYKPNA